MPLAIIDGVLRDKAGFPTAQLVAVVTDPRVSVRTGWRWGWLWWWGVALGTEQAKDLPEDKVPVLKPKADEVLASADFAYLLPEKHRVSGGSPAWKAEAPFLSPQCPGQQEVSHLPQKPSKPTLTTPCQRRRPLAVLVRTSSSMVSGTSGRLWAGEEELRGQKSGVPLSLQALGFS